MENIRKDGVVVAQSSRFTQGIGLEILSFLDSRTIKKILERVSAEPIRKLLTIAGPSVIYMRAFFVQKHLEVTQSLLRRLHEGRVLNQMLVEMRCGHSDRLGALIDRERINVNHRIALGPEERRYTPLHIAIRLFEDTPAASLNSIRVLLDRGADPLIGVRIGDTTIHEAVEHGNAAMVDMLLRKSPRSILHECSSMGESPLHVAVRLNRTAEVAAMLEYNPDLSLLNSDGKTAKEAAWRRGHEAIYNILDEKEQIDEQRRLEKEQRLLRCSEEQPLCAVQ